MDIKIEKDVPIPTSRHNYPFRELQVGESFLFPKNKCMSLRSNSYAFGIKQNPKREYVIRIISDTEARIWRTV